MTYELGPCGSINVKGNLIGTIYRPTPNPKSVTSIDSTQTFDCTNGTIPACSICIACFLYAQYPVEDSTGGFLGWRETYLDMSVRSSGGACSSVGNSTATTFSALPTVPGQRYRWAFGTNSAPGGAGQDSDTMDGDSPGYDMFDSIIFTG